MREARSFSFAVLPGRGIAPQEIISISAMEALVLGILNLKGELTGYDIAKCSEGKISVTVVYTLISRLHRKGLVTSRAERELVEDAITKGKRQKLEKRYWKMIDGLLLMKGGGRIRARDNIPNVADLGSALTPS